MSSPSTIKCPNCKKDALYQCDCVYKDKQCGNGHIWYVDKDGKIVGTVHPSKIINTVFGVKKNK